MIVEADEKAPDETGGMLLGYISVESSPEDLVIEAIIGPGPDARHHRTRFTPDSSWQQDQLARVYADSGRVTTYLGDWHTHPGGVAVPSRIDRRTARRISRSGAARVAMPLTLILASNEDGWRAVAYRFDCGDLRAVPMKLLHEFSQ